MLLRPRQEEFVAKCSTALTAQGNTIGIAPTGAGKTIMLAATALRCANKELPSLVLQHRDELVTQNRDKFLKFAGGVTRVRKPMTINADSKAWDRKGGGWNFAMIQTLIKNLDTMPPLGLLAIDEAHHVPADSYLRVIKRVKEQNPACLIYGTTATPNRGDRKALRTVFDNCGDHITISELIRSGHLVRPRGFTIDLGVQDELRRIRRTSSDVDQHEVSRIMNKTILNDKVVEKWEGFTTPDGEFISGKNRPSIFFASDRAHAQSVTDTFKAKGYAFEMIDDSLGTVRRREIIREYDQGRLQGLINIFVLTEGFDHQPTSFIGLLRLSSQKSTMEQMIGRGLRKVDAEIYPGVVKDDCITLDFGISLLTHGNIGSEPNLNGSGTKRCPECESTVPRGVRECPICGHEFPRDTVARASGGGEGGGDGEDETEVLHEFTLTEIDILNDSPFKYESFFDGRVMICFGFDHWAAVVSYQDGRFYGIGAESKGENNYQLHVVDSADSYLMALQSADDYMRTKSTKTNANRVAQWLYEQPTEKQLAILKENFSFGMTKYRACCAIQFKFYGNQVRGAIEGFKNARG